MALQGSGPIKLSEIATEFGGTEPHSLSEYYSAATGVPASGVISVSDFYGTSSAQPIIATGGSVTDIGGYRYHTFTGAGTLTVTQLGSGAFGNTIEYLVVAGGGGGGTKSSSF